jgi:hypothetical protein
VPPGRPCAPGFCIAAIVVLMVAVLTAGLR